MHNKQRLQTCIQHCQTTASEIKTLAGDAAGPARQSLDQAYQSINACISQCQNALNQI